MWLAKATQVRANFSILDSRRSILHSRFAPLPSPENRDKTEDIRAYACVRASCAPVCVCVCGSVGELSSEKANYE